MNFMKYILFILHGVVVFFFLSSFSANLKVNYSLTVEAENLRNSKGVVQFALYNKEGSIPDEHFVKYYKIGRAKIINGKAIFTFNDLPEGKYAVNVLHDENSNGKLDRGLILPKEGIGFSNYQSIGLSNKPKYSKAGFEINRDEKIVVKVIYM